jgi:hypothetical protein
LQVRLPLPSLSFFLSSRDRTDFLVVMMRSSTSTTTPN